MNPHHAIDLFSRAKKGKLGCLFCDPFEGMTLEETDNFRMLVDTFPIVPGHVMISSKVHYGSAGEVPSHLHAELLSLKDNVQDKLMAHFGVAFFYEHGRAGCCMAENPDGSKCEHFHLHCLPVDLDLMETLNSQFQPIRMNRYSEINKLFLEHGNYLFIESMTKGMCFYPAEDAAVESHLLRTLVCNALRVNERSNWETYKDPSLLVQSYELVERLDLMVCGINRLGCCS